MEFVYIGKRLWAKKLWVGAGMLLGGIAAVLVLFNVSGFPPKFESKAATAGAASTEILIDAQSSAFGDTKREIDPLTARGGIFTRFLGSEGATKAISAKSGIPAKRISVAGPKLTINGVPETSSSDKVAGLAKGRKYVLQVQQGDQLPVLSIFTKAPTKEGARRLANGTAAALAEVVQQIQTRERVPQNRRVEIRQLGEARTGEISDKPSIVFAALAFLGITGLACLLALAVPGTAAAWRSTELPRTPLLEAPALVTNGNGTGNGNGHDGPNGSLNADVAGRSVEAIVSAALVAADRIKEDARRDALSERAEHDVES